MNITKIYLQPGLYVIATPIGNISDITIRALQTFSSLDFIYSEDTRNSINLLAKYGINKNLKSYHKHSSSNVVEEILSLIFSGKSVGLISDSGTPNLSDPGSELLKALYENDLKAFAVPGPSSLTAAISISPIPLDSFYFAGFLPKKEKEILELINFINLNKINLIYLDSPKRLINNLFFIEKVLDIHAEIVVFKELTKVYEMVMYGSINYVINNYREFLSKGEFIVAIKIV